GRKLCAPTVTDFVHNVGANCVNLSKRTPVLVGLYVKFYVQIQHFWVGYVMMREIEGTTTVKQQNLIV
uniref:hypothetical protein n=1 Tax=Microcystis aeruginosa TaxID=1126 RepID=UPI00046A9EF1